MGRADLSVLGCELLDQLLKGREFLPINQIKLLNKENKVLEGGVEVRLLLQLDNRVKVLMVDVSVNTEESLQNGLGHRHKVLWERDPYF